MQAEERAKAASDNAASQQAAFDQANAANQQASTSTFASASPTSFNLAVGTSEATSSAIRGYLAQHSIYLQWLPRIYAAIVANGPHNSGDAIDRYLGTAKDSADAAAGIQPGDV